MWLDQVGWMSEALSKSSPLACATLFLDLGVAHAGQRGGSETGVARCFIPSLEADLLKVQSLD